MITKKSNIKFIIFLIINFTNLNSISNKDLEDKILRAEKLISKTEPKIKIILNKLKLNKEKRFKDLENKIRDQKKILFSFFRFTIYKEDITKLAFFSLDYTGKYLIYKKIYSEKIETIFNFIKNNVPEIEILLTESIKTKPEITENKLNLTQENTNLKDYLQKNYGQNIDILKFSILDNLKSYILNSIENLIIFESKKMNNINPNLTIFQNIKLLSHCPFFRISIANIFMHIFNPEYLLRKQIYNLDSSYEIFLSKILSSYTKFKIPDFIFYKSTKILINIIATVLTLKHISNSLAKSFSNYALANQEEFLNLIREYKNEKENGDKQKISTLEIKIKDFILKSFSNIRFDLFNQVKDIYQSLIEKLVNIPIALKFIMLEIKFFKNFNILFKSQ